MSPSRGEQPADARYIPAQVPGTAAAALRAQGEWRPGSGVPLDSADSWFRCRFDCELRSCRRGEILLELDGIATISEVRLNGRHILKSSSMFARHRLDVSGLVAGCGTELTIVCRALSGAFKGGRRGQQPAARWRTRVVSEQQLRWFRTTLLGRAPGFASRSSAAGGSMASGNDRAAATCSAGAVVARG